MKYYSLITGGSRGIGYALARECAGRGMNLLLVSRSEERLISAANILSTEFPDISIHVKAVNLSEEAGPDQIYSWCKSEGHKVNMLINNAALGGSIEFLESDPEYSHERIMVNVRALVLLTRLFLPDLLAVDRGYILNIGSMSAYYSIAYKSVYAASKAFLLSFTRALNQELSGSNVSVTVINPNGVLTNASTKGRIGTHSRMTRKLLVFESSKIAKISIDALLKGKLVILPGFFNRMMLRFTLLFPRGFRERRTTRIFKNELLASRGDPSVPAENA